MNPKNTLSLGVSLLCVNIAVGGVLIANGEAPNAFTIIGAVFSVVMIVSGAIGLKSSSE